MTEHKKFFPYLLICLFVLVVYLPSFTGEFLMDDRPLIESNDYIRDWHSIGSYLFQEDGCDSNSGNSHTGYYRPLVNLSYTLDYKIWGNLGPGFRITNLILHMAVCFVLFTFYWQIFNKKDTALWLALIFSLHPIVTETVSWAAARNNMLVTLFGLLSFYFYIKAYRSQRFFLYILSILFFSLSVFSKEFGLMLLPILFLYQRILNQKKEKLTTELREYIPFILIGVLYFILRQNVIGSFLSPKGLPDLFTRIYNLPYILSLNLWLVFLPYDLHSYILKLPSNFFSIGTLGGILFFIAVIYLLWRYRKNHLLLFSSLSFFMAIFPVSGVIPTSAPSIIAMRWLYFPMIFILIILSRPIEKLISSKSWMAFPILGCILMYLGFNSYILNERFWHSHEIFFKQEVFHFNNMYYADGLAEDYFAENNFVLAEKYFVKNIESGENRPLIYIKYAIILLEKGEIENSLLNLKKAEAYHTNHQQLAMILDHRGQAYIESKELNKALKEFKKADLFFPKAPAIWENMGVVYGEMGDHAKAVDCFKKAIRFQSKSENIYDNLALSYILNNKCKKALSLLDRKGFREKEKSKGLLERAKKCLANKS
jgi:protein O-mannosyl-transferase